MNTWRYPPRPPEASRTRFAMMAIMALAVFFAAIIGASITAKGIANLAHFNVTYIEGMH
ncbi:hypothetical protein [Sulfitobacter sp. EhC04]|uniref:hypothetical protein n=1 Tax=Sulfitobacter sp. EhC04 TaxID=1849168 RepID=UPI001372D19B|nr:hypothetical protein [Sulfitobacter sp. EhC04]